VLEKPEIVLAKSFRKMPQQNISATEIDRLIDFFGWVNEINNQDWPPQDSKTRRKSGVNRLVGTATMSLGAALFKENNCFDCHSLNGVGGSAGPALDDVGSRLTPDRIKEQIRNPEAFNPESDMPAYPELSEDDLQALAAFLGKQKGGEK